VESGGESPKKGFQELYIELAQRWERLAEVAERTPEHHLPH
jgi:hypothetical protein